MFFKDEVGMWESVREADNFLVNQAARTVMARADKFTFTELSLEEISTRIVLLNQKLLEGELPIIKLVPWRPFNVFTSATAYTTPSKPHTIFINTRKLRGRSVKDWARTLVHEWVHVYFPDAGHGSNSGQNKEPKLSSLPIWLASKV